jgi:hypothetical protein
MRRVAMLLLVGACGRISFDARQDARGDGASLDAELGAVSAPMPIAELNSIDEDDDPTLTDDELEIYFTSGRGNAGGNIWRSQRASKADAWDAPAMVTELSTAAEEQTPELTADGLTIFFARDAGTSIDIFMSTRAARGAPWSTPVRVTELASNAEDSAPATSPDQLTMIYTRGSVTADAQLLLTTRASLTDTWSAPAVVLFAAGQQYDQAWIGYEIVYYTVNTPKVQAIYRAQRTGPTTFGQQEAIPELDIPGDEADPWLPSAQRAIYFEHDNDLYVAKR